MGNVIEVLTDKARREAALENSSTPRPWRYSKPWRGQGAGDPGRAHAGHRAAEAEPAWDLGAVRRSPTREPRAHGARVRAGATAGASATVHASAPWPRAGRVAQAGRDLGDLNLSVLRRGELVFDRIEADWPLRLHLPVGRTSRTARRAASCCWRFKPRAERDAADSSDAVDALHRPHDTPTTHHGGARPHRRRRLRGRQRGVRDRRGLRGRAGARGCDGSPVAAGQSVLPPRACRLPRALEFVPMLNGAAAEIAEDSA